MSCTDDFSQNYWQKDSNSEAAASSSSSQPIQPNQLASTGRFVFFKNLAALDKQNMEDVQEDNEEFGQACTGRPVVQNNGTLDFQIHGLPHSQV